MSSHKTGGDLAKHSKAMWFSYVLDAITVVSLSAEVHIHLIKGYVPTWAYFVSLISVSVLVKTARIVSYDERARKRLGNVLARWARSPTPKQTDSDDTK